MAEKRSGSSLASLSGRQSVWTLARPRADAGLLGPLDGAGQPRRARDLVGRLVEKLAPVGEDEDAPAALGHALGHLGEDHGLAAAGGHDHERAAAPLPPLAEDRVDRLGLVGAQLHGH